MTMHKPSSRFADSTDSTFKHGLERGVRVTEPWAMQLPFSKRVVCAPVSVFLALVLLVSGCNKPASETAAGPKTFNSPDEAAQALYDAAKAGDDQAVLAIFGPDAKEFLFSGDAARDMSAYRTFTTAYEEMHRWGKLEGDNLVLIVGRENYPFPFPLLKNSSGKWYFDAESGRQELLARRIGDNELTVMDVLSAMADAQAEYFNEPRDDSKVRQYAGKFGSSEGKHDGLYWKVAEGEPESPLGPLVARATAEGYAARTAEAPAPFHGYYFRLLTAQGAHAKGGARNYVVNGKMTGGFAFLAYPADYRKSGVMSFLINQDGEIFQKDLGPQTTEAAKSLESFDPDSTWSLAE